MPASRVRPGYSAFSSRLAIALTLSTLLFGNSLALAQSPAKGPETRSIDMSLETFATEKGAPPQHRFKVAGLKAKTASEAASLFCVRVIHEDSSNSSASNPDSERALPPLMGKYLVAGDAAYFVPRFPLSPKVGYRVEVSPADTRRTLACEVFQLNTDDAVNNAHVTTVYPSAKTLPENLLKFYIHFSEPMNRGEAYERIKLFRGDELVDRPFLELGEELWNRDQTRFTLFIHPGLIKRGVKPREDQGPPLAQGSVYRLEISTDWSTASGGTLSAPFAKVFQVTRADHEQPNLEKWVIHTPKSGTRQPVGLSLNEPLDHAMLSRVLVVKHQDGTRIQGKIDVSESETRWDFTPDKAWEIGTYNIEVAANLEDLCGNSIARPFEVKMQDRNVANPATKVAIEFIVP